MKKIFSSSAFVIWCCIPTLFAQSLSFSPRGVGGGGALFFPRVNPANEDEFYVSCDMSQLFHTTDFGRNYIQVPFQQLQVFGAHSTYEWTNDPDVAYCNHSDGNDGYPVRTLDGGQSWHSLPGHDPDNGSVYRMTANYLKANQLLLNYYGAIFISSDYGATFQLVRQAADNGVGLIMGGAFFDGDHIYIGTNEGLLHSADGGATFSVLTASGLPAGQVIWQFAAGKSDGLLRFACITANAADVYNGVMPWEYWEFAKGVYLMDQADGSWQPRMQGIDFDNDFVMYVAMAWNDAQTIYLGGSDAGVNAPLVMKLGTTAWEKIFKSVNNENIQTGWSGYGGDKGWSWGETCFGISVAPYNSDRVLFSDFGFVHVSKNGGLLWEQAYVHPWSSHPSGSPTPKRETYQSIGLENTTCWQVHWHDEEEMLGAFSDIGLIRSTFAGNTWGFTHSGMSVNSVYRIVESPAHNMLFAATSGVHDMYQSTRLGDAILDANDPQGKVYFSTNGGANWQEMYHFGHPVFWLSKHPAQAILYASVIHYGGGGSAMQGGIYRNNFGPDWVKLPNPPRTEGHPAAIVVLNDGKVACSFSGRRNQTGAFTPSSGVFLYDPATNSWEDRSHPDMHYWTKDLVIDPSDSTQSTWYAGVFSGWGGPPNGKGGLFRSTDRGLHWEKLTGSQFDRVTSLSFNPLDTKQAYLTTETQGLWRSDQINAAIPDWNLVEEYPFRQPERVFFNPHQPAEMWVTSFGNGLKVAQINTSTEENPVEAATLQLWPNPLKKEEELHIRIPGTAFSKMAVITDALGRKIWQQEITNESFSMQSAAHQLYPGLYFVYAGGFCGKLVVE